MNERDELAKVIFTSNRSNTQIDLHDDRRLKGSQLAWARYAADAVLAAGYRKPRTVTTPDDLEALPKGSLLLSCSKYPMYAGTVWRISSGGMIEMVGREVKGVTPFRYFKDPLPATVLHEPEAGK